MEALHKLGYLPLMVKSLPEGVVVPIGVPPMTMYNTHKDFGWLTNSIETWTSTELWMTCTSATTTFVYRKILDKYVDLTGGSAEFSEWQIHDFCVRGMAGIYAAAKSGYGHLLSSLGTDNLPAVKLVNDVYRGKETFVGGSVPATEHSVMCAGGKESELETFRRLIKLYHSGVVSIVSDTWNLWNVIGGPTSLAAQLKDPSPRT
jgi:nicotinamide phosphoribosyltransferase